MALAREVVSEDHITRSKTPLGAIADPDFHLPGENKNVLPPGRGVPIAPIVSRETAEHQVGTGLQCNIVALLGRQREIFKMGLAVVARIYLYDNALTPSHREIIVHASLSEDEGVVPESFGTWAHDKVHQRARREYRFSRITPFRIVQVPVGRRGAARRHCWRDRRRLRWSSARPASLTTDPVERVVVVMKNGAARKAPLAVLFDQLARVAAGRKAAVVAVL